MVKLKNLKNRGKAILSEISFIKKLYNPFFVGGSVVLFLIIYFFPIKFFPDYFHFQEIQNYRSFIWGLLTISIGFSGFILTILLVAYNFYLKSTRRNTTEFIIENPWLKIIFSVFASSTILNILGYFVMNQRQIDKAAVLYFLLIYTSIYILILFPVVILSLKYSTSMHRIKKVMNSIDNYDLDSLYNPDEFMEKNPFEKIESNRIILLTDIGRQAIKDSDWLLPQSIIVGFKDRFFHKYDDLNNVEIKKHLYNLLFICKSFKRTALQNSDSVTVNVVYSCLLNTYYFLAKKNNTNLFRDLDEVYKDFCYELIDSSDYPNIRDSIAKDILGLMKVALSKPKYSNEQLPTMEYRKISHMVESNSDADAMHIWHYLVSEQVDLFTDIIKYSMLKKDIRVFERLHWKIDSFLNEIHNCKNLTEEQLYTYIDEALYDFFGMVDCAMKNDIYEDLEIISYVTVLGWMKKDRPFLVIRCLHFYSRIIKKLNKEYKVNYTMLDHFFMIGRSASHSSITQKLKEDVITCVLDMGIKIFETRVEDTTFKNQLQYQIKFLFSFFKEENSLEHLRDKYIDRVQEITSDYSGFL